MFAETSTLDNENANQIGMRTCFKHFRELQYVLHTMTFQHLNSDAFEIDSNEMPEVKKRNSTLKSSPNVRTQESKTSIGS